VPRPAAGPPPAQIWWKNHILPALFRRLTWNGLGLPYYRWRVIWFQGLFFLTLPIAAVRLAARLLRKQSK